MSKRACGSTHGPHSLIDEVDRRSNKVFRSDAESSPRNSTTRRPWMEMARLSGLSAGREQTANEERTGPTLLDLPLELREHIYHSALQYTAQRLCRPYDALPGHDRFNAYLNLRVTNRQISQEAETIFAKHYKKDMVFYFDNPPDLWDFWQQIKRNPTLWDTAKFCLRSTNDDEKSICRRRNRNLKRRETERLIDKQGNYEIWRNAPNLYSPLTPSSTDIILLEDLYGCASQDADHSECHATIGSDCRPYTEIVYGPCRKSTLLRGFLWDSIFDSKDEPERVGSLTLEGSICNLFWGEYDLKKGRKRMKQYKDYLCNGRFPEFFQSRSSFEHAEDHMLAEIEEEDEADEVNQWLEDQAQEQAERAQFEARLEAEFDARLEAEREYYCGIGFDC